jgi:hypothetical protein
MCGICGQFNFSDHTPVLRSDIERMTRSIVHRGPDVKATSFLVRWVWDFGGFPSSILAAGTSRCPTKRNPCGWFSTRRSTTSRNSGVVLVIENMSFPRDGRVRQEALALASAGLGVSVICPRDDVQNLSHN